MKTPILLWIFLAAVFGSLPVILIKKYIETKEFILLFLCIGLYVLLIISYYKVFQSFSIIVGYPIIKVLSDLLVICLGIFMFHETLNIKKYFGLLFALFSIYLLSS
jgi:multidrug transporter EmrE-like cation transporter